MAGMSWNGGADLPYERTGHRHGLQFAGPYLVDINRDPITERIGNGPKCKKRSYLWEIFKVKPCP